MTKLKKKSKTIYIYNNKTNSIFETKIKSTSCANNDLGHFLVQYVHKLVYLVNTFEGKILSTNLFHAILSFTGWQIISQFVKDHPYTIAE